MYDGFDSDDFDNGGTRGKLLQSGIRPDAERADYALPPGVSALQDGEPEFHPVQQRTSLLSRRKVFLMATGGMLLSAVVGFALGWATSGASAASENSRALGTQPRQLTNEELAMIAKGREWAAGPIEDLVASHRSFIYVVEIAPSEVLLWDGLDKLCQYALLQGGERGLEIAESLLASFQFKPPPARFNKHQERLSQLVRYRARRGR